MGDFDDQLVVFDNFSKDGVRRRSGGIEPIQKGIIGDVDKELRSSRLGASRVGHGQCSGGVGNLLVGLANFVRNAAVVGARVGLAIQALELGARVGTAGTRARTVGVLGVGATELVLCQMRNEWVCLVRTVLRENDRGLCLYDYL